MQTISPAPNALFCQQEEAENTTTSGILLASKPDRPKIAHVINIGKNVTNYHPKDRIVYKPYATTEIKIDGEEYFLISEEDVLGKVVTND